MKSYFAPASTGNFSVGFDLLGAAFETLPGGPLLGDELVIIGEAAQLSLTLSGRYVHQLPSDSSDNLVLQCFDAFEKKVGKTLPRLQLNLKKHLPVGSGLGSSACSIVVACYAFNDYFGSPLTSGELLQLTAECEGRVSGSVHYDNVAPSLHGGLQLMMPESAKLFRQLPWFEHWQVVLSYPGTVLSTKAARAVLPQQLSLKHSISFAGPEFAALYANDEAEALLALQDVIAEPARTPLIPELPAIRQALMQEGIGHVGISGAGPTLFAVCTTAAQAEFAANYLRTQYEKNADGMTQICQLSHQGARVLSSSSDDKEVSNQLNEFQE